MEQRKREREGERERERERDIDRERKSLSLIESPSHLPSIVNFCFLLFSFFQARERKLSLPIDDFFYLLRMPLVVSCTHTKTLQNWQDSQLE